MGVAMKRTVFSRNFITLNGLREKPPRLLVAVCFLVFMFSLVGPETPEARPGYDAVYAAVWSVWNGKKTGTAFAIGDNRFMTNAHVIKDFIDTGDLSIFLSQKGNPHRLRFKRLVALSTTYDLAVFETKETVDHWLRFADSFSKKETGLYVVGYPKMSFTVLEQTKPIGYEDPFSYEFAVNSAGFPKEGLGGLSGAPVLNAEDEVVMVFLGDDPNDSSLLRGVKREIVQKLVAGDRDIGVICSFTDFPDHSSRCFQRAIEQTIEMAKQGNPVARYQLNDDYLSTGQ